MKEIIHQLPSWMLEYKFFIVFISAVLISSFLIPQIIRFSLKNGWVDVPDGRKIHLRSIPNLGGIAIIIGLFCASLFWYRYFRSTDFIFIVIGVLILFFTGIFDDIKGMKAKKKLLFQILSAFIAVAGGIRITSLQGFLGIGELNLITQYVFSIIVIVGVINAYNLIDGIDGLAGGIGVINLSVIGYVFYTMGHTSFALISFAGAGSLLGFLIYNFTPARIFMGDTGAMTLGFLTVILGIKAIELNNITYTHTYLSQHMLLFISSIMFLPVFDTLRVFTLRIIHHKSPFTPGKDHLHHVLLKLGFKPVQVTVFLYTLNVLVILMGFLINYLKPLNLFVSTLFFKI
jgi:UDP-GlcNAc:undecaprenyl-phosphate/decaprenyl-phosphate GlcNAc-1-phosphate transferase